MENDFRYDPYQNTGDGAESTKTEYTYSRPIPPPPVGYTAMTPPPVQEAKKESDGFASTVIKVIAIALIFGLVAGATGLTVMFFGGGFLSALKNDPTNVPTLNSTVVSTMDDSTEELSTVVTVTDVSGIVKNVMPCVVAINNEGTVTHSNAWGQSYKEKVQSAGTGFIVKQDSNYIYIATNNHVVANADTLTVQFSDATQAKAEIKGTVASKDLAVIRVSVKNISTDTMSVIRVASLGDSNKIKVGQFAIAIGNALGYGQSVTTGVISALGRSVTVSDATSGETIVCNNLIQTEAAINPGNSGGALLNSVGEVIGINSVKYSDTSVEGIGYAIPISDAMLIINKLINGGKIDETQSGYLGIYGQDCDYGVYISEVIKDSAAEDAGLKEGDIITKFDGHTISTMSQLKELLSYYSAGETLEFVVYRAQGESYVEKKINVKLGDASMLE